jgi:hypothetical protein
VPNILLVSRYVACQLTQGSGDQQAMGFALFETAAMAVAAKDALQVSLDNGQINTLEQSILGGMVY